MEEEKKVKLEWTDIHMFQAMELAEVCTWSHFWAPEKARIKIFEQEDQLRKKDERHKSELQRKDEQHKAEMLALFRDLCQKDQQISVSVNFVSVFVGLPAVV